MKKAPTDGIPAPAEAAPAPASAMAPALEMLEPVEDGKTGRP
ncbi:hypothetical protein [Streptomyces incanus]|uniref:Uncharacterized protein n=1 Tax=Streptomyces incanus TaxID=887453 RepID=A0ABW0Y0H9_9ACTN